MEGKTELELAKELIAKVEQEQVKLAQDIYVEASKKINDLGFKIEVSGQFQGNKLECLLMLVKL